jgi:Transmembrane domain of unknown function (DUF3566)
VTSPNEPGYTGPGDSPNGNGSVDRGGDRAADADATARNRGAARPSQAQQRQPAEVPNPREPRPGGRAPASPNAEARLNRFISGTAAPGAAKTPPPDVDAARQNDAYASELPDLSGPIPRAGQRKPPADTSTAPVRTEGRVQVASRPRSPVRASMQIRRIDPWSTLKVSLVLSVALFFVWMIAVALLYLVLGGMGVWSKLNSNVGDLLNNNGGSAADLVSSGTIFGGAVLVGLVNIVLLTAAATIGAFIYNLTTDLIGGVEVTLADRD